jgi:hypothetical protein
MLHKSSAEHAFHFGETEKSLFWFRNTLYYGEMTAGTC